MRDALALGQSGATNAAGRLAAGALKEGVDDRLARAVISYLDRDRRAKERDALGDLIKKLEDRKKAMAAAGDGDWKDSARPRILACIGPGVRLGGPEAENLALLYQIGLRSELQGLGRMQVIEREALEQVLQEMQLGASDVADARARMEIGKLLPAGLLLLGDVLPSADGEKVFLRLVETETTKIVASFSAERKAQDDAAVVCADLAARVAAKAVAARPLEALATRTEGDRLRARVGRFHGADEKTRYVLLERTAVDAGGQDFREKEVGRAVVAQAGELSSDLTPEWNAEVASKPPKSVWAREAAAQ
jgi:hypothetical protein